MKIDHIAILVEDIEDALPFWRDALGLELAANVKKLKPKVPEWPSCPPGKAKSNSSSPRMRTPAWDVTCKNAAAGCTTFAWKCPISKPP